MKKESKKEYVERLRQSTKEMLDEIGTDTEIEQTVIKLIYGFTYSGYRECMAGACLNGR
ncbi:MAG: hypothetical protein K2M46_14400 [Lachnospiraceae bacterium]|nr:hypothetical protein [Lachnospiraceae bacterium]